MAPAKASPVRPEIAVAARRPAVSAAKTVSRRVPAAETDSAALAIPRRTASKLLAKGEAAPEPAPPDAQSASIAVAAPGASPRIGQRDANRLLGEFSRAYEQGDLQQMRELFASEGRGQRGSVSEVLEDYRRVFDNSRERSLLVRDVNWFQDGENITIVAGYEASVTSRGGKERRTHGDIRLDLRRESDSWRIYRVRRDERRG
jgi:hypothetical protein